MKLILKGSDTCILERELLCFWTLAITWLLFCPFWNSRPWTNSRKRVALYEASVWFTFMSHTLYILQGQKHELTSNNYKLCTCVLLTSFLPVVEFNLWRGFCWPYHDLICWDPLLFRFNYAICLWCILIWDCRYLCCSDLWIIIWKQNYKQTAHRAVLI
jgi:hypothetical protein